jgi:hypothetical protein
LTCRPGGRSSQSKDKVRCLERNHQQIAAVFAEISKFSSTAGNDDLKKRVKKASNKQQPPQNARGDDI